MSLLELLDELRGRGIRLRAEDGRLKFSGPKGGMTEALRARVAAERGALLALLAEQPAPDRAPAAEEGGPAPLSHAQQRLWVVEQIEGIGTAYAIPGAAEIAGPLDAAALERALAAVMRRQASLRTALRLVEGEPRQVVEPDPPLPFALEDLTGEADPEAAARARLAALAAEPFDLARAPLFRARLLRLAPERHRFAVVLHHAIADGWSIALLLRELGAAYAEAAAGRAPESEPLVPGYAELARRERGPEGRARIERQLGYWRERLAGAPELLELPADRPRPPVQSFRGAAACALLPAETVERLRALAQDEGATLFMALFAVFAALVARYSGERDFVLGTPVAGRDGPESQRLVGLFVNTLPLRCDLSGRPGFRALLGRVRRGVLEAFDHQDVPFERLVDALQPARDPRYPPLCQVLFALQSALDERLELAGAELTPLPLETGGSRVDLFLAAEPRDDGALGLEAEYCSDLFEAPRIERLLRHFVNLAAAAAAAPERPVESLPMLDPEERRGLLSGANRLVAPLAPPLTLPARFAAVAASDPEAVAVAFGDERQSYAELQAAAGRIAAALAAAGVRPREVVGLHLPRCLLLPAALLGILGAGAAYLPLEPDLPAARRRALLADAGVRVVLTAETLLPELAGDGPACLAVERAARCEGEVPPVPEAPDSLAYVIYTSGSTGGPKGVCVSHRSVLRLVEGLDYEGPVPRCFLQVCSTAFDVSTFEIWGALLTGARLAIPPPGPLEPAVLKDCIERHGVEALWLTAGLFHRMAESLPDTLAGVRRLLAGGDVVQPAAAQAVLDRMAALGHHDHRFGNGYGPTECTTFGTLHWMRPGQRLGQSVPIGRALGNTALYVVDPVGEPVPTGVPGELWLGGLGVARGYLGRPGLTAERFLPDPFNPPGRVYRTGDRVRWLADGTLEFLGRIDQQVKLRGFRVEPGEIEQALLGQPGVAEAVVVVRTAPSGAKQLVGYLVAADPAAPPAAEELRAALAARLPAYMVPSRLLLLERLPLNRSGKVDRRALPTPDEAAERAPSRPPEGAAEQALAAIWRDLLKREAVGAEDNFFALGGDSILAMQVVLRAGEAGLRIGLRDLLERQTVAGLAAAAQARGRAGSAAPGQRSAVPPVPGPLPLTPVQRWFFERRLARADHWNQAVLLAARAPLDPQRLQAGLDALAARHEALRQRFGDPTEARPVTIAAPAPVPLEVHPPLGEAARAARAEALQAGLDLAAGPLLRAALFRLPEGSEQLLLAAHHLAVDAVSWHVLLHELSRFLETGALPAAPPPTPWSAYAASVPAVPRPRAEPVQPLPRDLAEGADGEATAARAERQLDRAATEAFLGPANEALRSEPTELLLAALSAALLDWSGGGALTVEVERHGRDVLPELDLSQTVGWLTRLDPRRIERPARDAPGDWLAAARSAPAAGEAGERAEVALNYLGRMDGAAEGLLAPAEGPTGALYAAGAERRHLFELIAEVSAARLRLSLRYSPARHRPETAAGLVEAITARLEAILDWARQPANGGLLPQDVPLAGLDRPRLERLLAAIPGEEERHAARDVETILPLSPQQQGMLLDSLADAGSGVHHEQLTVRLEGPLDPALLRQAWRQVAERHAILRTGFYWSGLPQPLQVVFRRPRLEWHERPGEPDVDWLRQDRLAAFDLARPGAFRLTLWRAGASDWRLVWSFHHLLLDGWSTALLLREVMALYEAGRRGRPAELPPAPPYGAYVAWLAGRDAAATEAFWRDELAGLPTLPPLAFGGEPDPEIERFGEGRAILGEAEASALAELAQRLAVTPGTLVQGAWALLLAGLLRRDALVFGATSAGRPEALPDSAAGAGLFIDTLPVRVEVPATGAVADWLGGLFARWRRILAHPHLGAGALQRAAGLPADRPLFEALLVYENYPQEPAAGPASADGPRVAELASCGARTRYPLTLLAVPEAGLRLQLVHDRRRLPDALAARLLELLVGLLSRLAGGEMRIEALRALVAAAELPEPAPQAAAEPPPGPRPRAAAETPLERSLAEIWAALLGRDAVPADRSFFELGGHSLLALEMAAAVERRLGLSLDAGLLLRAPTLRDLAAALSRLDLPAAAPLVTLAEGESPPLVVLPGASGNPLAYLPLARRLAGRRVLGVQLAALPAAGGLEAMAGRLVEALPAGPLHLLGHSFGAALAYETARRLEAQGRPAPLVALLDLAAPEQGAPAPQGAPDEASLLAEIAEAASRYFDRPLALERRRLAGPGGRRAFLEALAGAGLVSPAAEESVVEALLGLYRGSLSALAAWRPGALAGPVTVLRARDSETTAAQAAPDLGWSRWTAVAACHSLPGDHIGLIREPWVAGLAELLRAELASRERDVGAIAACT